MFGQRNGRLLVITMALDLDDKLLSKALPEFENTLDIFAKRWHLVCQRGSVSHPR